MNNNNNDQLVVKFVFRRFRTWSEEVVRKYRAWGARGKGGREKVHPTLPENAVKLMKNKKLSGGKETC